MSEYKMYIGLEIHVQLKTRSKLFCGCSTEYGSPPNTNVCCVCLGYPGSLPVLNKEALRLVVVTGAMIDARINTNSRFERKSYFYPDMPKNYQISQYTEPLCKGGGIEIETSGRVKNIRIRRIHLEEDVAKNVHFGAFTGIDFNRAGIPLMEIVTEPDMNTPEEAYEFLKSLKGILLCAGVSNCNLEEGNFRCDVNCSVSNIEGAMGTKIEIKNLNTFKGVLEALEYERIRQIKLLESGGNIVQETRRWDADKGITIPMRTKEFEHDYRYCPDPDLMPVFLSDAQISEWTSNLPETPRRRKIRYMKEYNLSEYDATVIASDHDIALFFDKVSGLTNNIKETANFVMTVLKGLTHKSGKTLQESNLTPESFAAIISLYCSSKINSNTARQLIETVFEKGGDPLEIVKEEGLMQLNDEVQLEAIIRQVLRDNPACVSDYRRGKNSALKFLIGQVMRITRGKANPEKAGILIEKILRDEG